MILLKSAPEHRVLIACRDRALRDAITGHLTGLNQGRPGQPRICLLGDGSSDVNADVLLVEVGDRVGLDLFRQTRERFPNNALVVCARPEDAELAEVATDHGADSILFVDQTTPELARAVIGFAVERNAFTHQLVAAREREAELSTHDGVTGLANRSLAFTCLDQALNFALRQQGTVAVLIVGCQAFAGINERFGYRAGDKLLTAVGERISDHLPDGDTIGRLGGDEFIVVLNDVASRSAAVERAHQIIERVAHPIYISGHRTTMGLRIGIALGPEDGRDAETLVTLAHGAMRNARTGSRNIVTADSPDHACAS